MFLQHWGATEAEIHSDVVGDSICSSARVVATRCISVKAPPTEVFPWIRQMGFGKAGWYSYDWLDNLGRKSSVIVKPEWQDIVSGSQVPGGPISFTAEIVDAPSSFVLSVIPKGKLAQRLCFTLAYELREEDGGTRIVTRMRARVSLPFGRFIERFILTPGDGIMVRQQLLNLAKRVNPR